MFDFDTANITNISLFYTALPWSGLKGTITWNELSPTQKADFKDTYRVEDKKGGCLSLIHI